MRGMCNYMYSIVCSKPITNARTFHTLQSVFSVKYPYLSKSMRSVQPYYNAHAVKEVVCFKFLRVINHNSPTITILY